MTMLPIEPGQPGFNIGQIPTTQFNLPAPKAKSGGMFGGGKFGLKEAIAFGLAGFMARRNPMLLQGLMGSMMQKQRGEQDEQNYQRQRQDEMADWMAKQEYARANPSPVNNDTANDWQFYQQNLSPQEFETWKANKINPPQIMNVPGVGIVAVPRAPQGVPSAPVGKLTPIDGGPSPLGSGGFPRSF